VARRLASPAARRYMAGWFSATEVHVLAPERLRELAGAPDSLDALLLTPQRVYTMLVAGSDNPLLPPPFRPQSLRSMRRTPWLLEGIAQFLSGQVPLLRPGLAIRLREGPVRFPPSRRDSPLVAGAVFDLLAERQGEAARVGAGGVRHRADFSVARAHRAARIAAGGRHAAHERAQELRTVTSHTRRPSSPAPASNPRKRRAIGRFVNW
jgi:hypothetical protein